MELQSVRQATMRRSAYEPRTEMPRGGRLIQAFRDIDMRLAFDGLTDVCKKAGIELKSLKPGEYVAFFNSKRTYLKLATANNVIASRRMDHGRFYDLTCINGIIEAFQNTGKIDYDKVLRNKLTEMLGRKGHVKLEASSVEG